MRKKAVSAIHPGEFLAEILDESGLSQAQFARMIGVSPMRVNLQSAYDLRKARRKLGARLRHIEKLVA
ncbi:MAG TPA: hypothetical protein VMF67_05885 [Rhizomicrobium sp.]|nr:hypothetical protein [Rhizomicrobium sp.]